MKQKILIIEDDARLANLIKNYLSHHEYQAEWHERGDTAEEKINALNPELLILDVMLPGKSGFDICRDIRSWYTGFILIMTASEDNIDEIVGLELGADDYLAKPVEPRLLLARIKALLRRKQASSSDDNNPIPQPSDGSDNLIHIADLVINHDNRQVMVKQHPIDLTTAEYDLLWLLVSHAGQILSRDDIFSHMRGIEFDGADRSIDARISRLRRKIDDDPDNPRYIKTIRGKGYLFLKKEETN